MRTGAGAQPAPVPYRASRARRHRIRVPAALLHRSLAHDPDLDPRPSRRADPRNPRRRHAGVTDRAAALDRCRIRRVLPQLRNTPLVVLLFFLFLGLPLIGLRFSTDTFENIFRAAAVGMGLYHGAYVAEVVRGGLLGVDRGQIEAARSLGLSYAQMLRYVQLPQTFRSVIPPLGNIAIALVKNTSLASTIGVAELLYAAEI
ncbi:MAG: ABC transporter permease subunit, partial [Chloroflexi bacterium]